MQAFDPTQLQQGDAMLYYGDSPVTEPKRHASFVDWAIAVKTGYWFSHMEIYNGANLSLASRNGIGVNRYQTRFAGLVCVRRPKVALNWQNGLQWFLDEARGQGYDFKGLLCFYLAVHQGSANRMFCSEFATRLYRKCGFDPFNPQVDADRVAPCEFWKTNTMETIWQKEGFEP